MDVAASRQTSIWPRSLCPFHQQTRAYLVTLCASLMVYVAVESDTRPRIDILTSIGLGVPFITRDHSHVLFISRSKTEFSLLSKYKREPQFGYNTESPVRRNEKKVGMSRIESTVWNKKKTYTIIQFLQLNLFRIRLHLHRPLGA